MPKEHREFLAKIEESSHVRQLVINNKQVADLVANYNACINLVTRFRQKHLEYAAAYIFKQNQTSSANPSAVGTGGTPFMPYLKKHKDESTAFLI